MRFAARSRRMTRFKVPLRDGTFETILKEDHSDLVGGNCFLIDCLPPSPPAPPPGVSVRGPPLAPRKTARSNDVSWGRRIRSFQISPGVCEIAGCHSAYWERKDGGLGGGDITPKKTSQNHRGETMMYVGLPLLSRPHENEKPQVLAHHHHHRHHWWPMSCPNIDSYDVIASPWAVSTSE